MKKILAILLTLVMVFACTAIAEEAATDTATENAEATDTESSIEWTEVTTEELGEDYATVELAELESTIALPADWLVLEIPQEQADAGILYNYASADGTRQMNIAYSEVDTEVSYESIMAEYAAQGITPAPMTINGINYILIPISETVNSAVLVWGDNSIVVFSFSAPADDAEMGDIVTNILGSLA